MLGGSLRALLAAGALLGGCSLFVPDDEEYVGGSDADAGTSGGSAGTIGGSSGSAGSGGAGGSGGSLGGAGGSSGAGGSGGSSGGAGGSTGGGGGAGGNGGSTGGSGGSTGGSGGTGGVVCAPGSQNLPPQPVALYLMQDRTSSMSGAEWSAATQGIEGFVSNPAVTGSIGLQYFPILGGQGSCTGAGFDMPEIAISPLPGIASAITQSLSSTNLAPSPSQLAGVLAGGTDYALGHAAANPNMQVNFVLLTDYSGQDTCGAPNSALIATVQSAAEADPPVRTHVITFVSFGGAAVLDSLAQAGGSQQATDANDPQDVQVALQRAQVACRYSLPPTGTPGSSATLNIGGPTVPLTEVGSAAACQSMQFFLSGSPPTALVLCPDACNAIQPQASPSVTIDISCP